MSDQLIVVSTMVGLGFLLVAGAWLGAGSHTALVGLFAAHGGRDWPTGVQEADAPHFAVAHLDNLRPAAATPPESFDDGGASPEIVDLGGRHLETRSE